LVPPLIAAAGVGVERWLLRPVGKIRNSDVMVTFGLAMIMEYVVLIVFGGAPQRIPYPVDVFLPMPGGRYPLYRIVVAAVSAICLTVVGLVLKRTAFGLYIRAAHQDFELARALGIPVSRVLMLTFGAGCACAALAGIMTAPLVGVEFRMGVDIMAVSFLVTILGGLTRIHAIALVALASGISENLLAIVLEPILARGVLLVALLSALIIMYARRGSDRIV
jgi:branched-chain amino acid transport system permease protein